MFYCPDCHRTFEEPTTNYSDGEQADLCKCGSDRFELVEEVELPKQVNSHEE